MKLNRTLEISTTVVLLCVALLFGAVLARDVLGGSRSERPVRSAGDAGIRSLPITNIAKTSSPYTLVLGLSTTCPYCTMNRSLYAKLSAYTRTISELRIVALFPQPVDEGRQYLTAHGVDVHEIRSMDLTPLGIRGTPTIFLVKQDGTVVSSWAGMVPDRQHDEVLHAVRQKVRTQ
jgi:thioredoxin-related protein